MARFHHFVACTRSFFKPLRERDACADLWLRLRARFQDAAACILMPDHLHLLAPKARDTIWVLGIELRAWTQRHHPGKRVWQEIPEPEPIRDHFHLKRQIRYVHLNPCRSGIAKDPLEWEWSTHRDLVGLVADPWPDRALLREVFCTSDRRLADEAHRYISSDPSVSVSGTQFPRSDGKGVADLRRILWAAASFRRESISRARGPQRDLAIRYAERIGLRSDPQFFDLELRAWNRIAAGELDPRTRAALGQIVSDPRLLGRFETS